MTTATDAYCSFHGLDISSIAYAEGIDTSGGALSVEDVSLPGRDYADVRDKGRTPKKYKIRVRSTDREEMESLLREVNTAPHEAEFRPFDEGRMGYVARSHASLRGPKRWGTGKNFYEADIEIVCREAWLYGPDQGIGMSWNQALPAVSGLLTNEGHMAAPLSYMQCSGARVADYIEGLSLRMTPGTSTAEHDRELVLCDKLLRGDVLELGWRGEVWHSWQASMISMAGLSYDVHGMTSGGSIASGVLTLDNSDYLMIPFYGPLPVAGDAGSAYLDLIVDEITGSGATVCVALETDLSDIAEVDHDPLVVGRNLIYVPELEGEEHVAIGLRAGAVGSVSISSLAGMVRRYIAPSQIPAADPEEEFKIRVESTSGDQLRFLQACWNNRYWY